MLVNNVSSQFFGFNTHFGQNTNGGTSSSTSGKPSGASQPPKPTSGTKIVATGIRKP